MTTSTNKQELTATKALLESFYGNDQTALTYTAKVYSTDKNGAEKVTNKKVTLSCDTIIGDHVNGKLYQFTVNSWIGGTKPKVVLGLVLDYDGQISTFSNSFSIDTKRYSVDGYEDNVTLNILAVNLLARLSQLNDGAIALFFDLLKLNGYVYDVTKDNLPILSKVKLDQIAILKLFVNRGKECLPNSPLRIIADQCVGLLPEA